MNLIYYWILIGVVAGLLISFRPWKHLGGARTPEWVKKHRFWTVVIVLVCLAILPQIVWAGSWILAMVLSGPDQVFRGTPRSAWGIGQKPIGHVIPQGKSLGNGPLLWEDSENLKNIEIRNRLTTENIKNGVCFVGFVPPETSMQVAFTDTSEARGTYTASLVDFGTAGGKLASSPLKAISVSQHHQRCIARKLEELSSPKRMESIIINNRTSPEEGGALNEMYLQVEGSQAPSKIKMYRTEPHRYQYVVKVGVNEPSFTVPHQNWKWLWIVPVQHEDYQLAWDGKPFPAAGVDGVLGLKIKINGEEEALDRTYLLRPQDLNVPEIKLGLTLQEGTPRDRRIEKLKPARVIVGIQM